MKRFNSKGKNKARLKNMIHFKGEVRKLFQWKILFFQWTY